MIRIPWIAERWDAVWETLIDLQQRAPTGWRLIGAQMVALQALEHGRVPPRRSEDADVLANVRAVQHATRHLSQLLDPSGSYLEVPGGTQALRRTELVEVETGTHGGLIPRPNLLGAMVLKARAVDVDDVPANQREDLAFLLSLLDNLDAWPRKWPREIDARCARVTRC